MKSFFDFVKSPRLLLALALSTVSAMLVAGPLAYRAMEVRANGDVSSLAAPATGAPNEAAADPTDVPSSTPNTEPTPTIVVGQPTPSVLDGNVGSGIVSNSNDLSTTDTTRSGSGSSAPTTTSVQTATTSPPKTDPGDESASNTSEAVSPTTPDATVIEPTIVASSEPTSTTVSSDTTMPSERDEVALPSSVDGVVTTVGTSGSTTDSGPKTESDPKTTTTESTTTESEPTAPTSADVETTGPTGQTSSSIVTTTPTTKVEVEAEPPSTEPDETGTSSGFAGSAGGVENAPSSGATADGLDLSNLLDNIELPDDMPFADDAELPNPDGEEEDSDDAAGADEDERDDEPRPNDEPVDDRRIAGAGLGA